MSDLLANIGQYIDRIKKMCLATAMNYEHVIQTKTVQRHVLRMYWKDVTI